MRTHRALLIALVPAVILRLLAVVGYSPALYFWADSFAFLREELAPGTTRPSGYSLLLALLRPAHSLTLVTVLQHLAVVGLAVAIYAFLRKRGLPGWGATLLVTPILFDEFMILLEHMIMADAVFIVLITAAVLLLIWRSTPVTSGVAGLLLGLAGIFRTVGLPLLVLAAAYVLLKRYGWRSLTALLVAGAVPLGAYAVWAKAEKGTYALTQADGNFLWSRTMSFADCEVIRPPAELAVLCPNMPVEQRPYPPHWLWEDFSPLLKIPGIAHRNELAGQFAREAIMAQPFDYLQAVSVDFKQFFRWERTASDESSPYKLPSVERPLKDFAKETADSYEGASASTGINEPFAGWLRAYQRFGYLPFPLFTLGLLVTLGFAAWRRDLDALFPGVTALALLVSPPFLAAFDLRYVIPAIPLACLAAGLTMLRGESRPHSMEEPRGPRHSRRHAQAGNP
ncbi:hypothetical protein ACIBH1_44335 [Nonomuraea sp. NPDC050663]|uniref:hypothetical protein n=1 Tax=Nonomuraea sp. NPDC050663 TaxID=3364370 RepID=UPI00378D7C15